jgi:hypothetical protein
MFSLGALAALELSTGTPDALCPPLEEARAAIRARVGEVRGDFRAEFALIRGDDGGQLLELVLREGPHRVLHRELPLDAAGCRDAAQAIALVLERYFDTLEQPQPDAEPDLATVPAALEPSPAQSRPPARRADSARPMVERREAFAWRAHVGALYDWEHGPAVNLGGRVFPTALRVAPRLRFGVGLDAAPFLRSKAQTIRAEPISVSTLQAALSFPLGLTFDRWCAAFGPWVQVRLQHAEAPSLAHQQSGYRVLSGWGAFAELGWSVAPAWTVGLGGALGGQPTGVSSRFVLIRADGSKWPVLVPKSWFAQTQLTLALAL